jgi:hypothetical protein
MKIEELKKDEQANETEIKEIQGLFPDMQAKVLFFESNV